MNPHELDRQVNAHGHEIQALKARVEDLEHRVGLIIDKKAGHAPHSETGQTLKSKNT